MLYEAVLDGARLERVNMEGARASGMSAKGADFTGGAVLRDAIMVTLSYLKRTPTIMMYPWPR